MYKIPSVLIKMDILLPIKDIAECCMKGNFFLLHRKTGAAWFLILRVLNLRAFINIFSRGRGQLVFTGGQNSWNWFSLQVKPDGQNPLHSPLICLVLSPWWNVTPDISQQKMRGYPCTTRTSFLDLVPDHLDYSVSQYRFHVRLACKICLFAFCFHMWCNHMMHCFCSPQCLLQAVFEKIKILLQYSMFLCVVMLNLLN